MSPTGGDKMFRVIVLGGLALVSYEACGGTVTTGDAGSDASNGPDSFPSELPTQIDASKIVDAAAEADAFPSELPVQGDGG